METKIRWWTLSYLVIVQTCAVGQYVHHGTINTSIRNAAVLAPEFTDPLVSVYNPSLLPKADGVSANIYLEKRYLLKELMQVAVATSLKVDNAAVSVTFSHVGTNLYREHSYAVCYGMDLGKLCTGVQMGYVVISSERTKILRTIITRLSIKSKLSDKVFCSVNLVDGHAMFGKVDTTKLRSAASFHFSIGYSASDQLYIGIESQKQEQRTTDVIPTISFSPSPHYVFRSSWSTRSGQPFFSTGWKTGVLLVEAGFSYHITLGFSPLITLLIQKEKAR